MLNLKSGDIQIRHMHRKTHIELSIKSIGKEGSHGKSEQAQKELAHELAKFQAEQALKSLQKLPCSTEQKLELVDTAVKHLKAQQ